MNIRKFLFEDEPVEGITSPFDYPYIKILRLTLVIITSWPSKEMGQYESPKMAVLLRIKYLFITIGCIFGAILYVIKHMNELTFLEVGHMYITILMTGVNVSRVTTLTCNQHYRDIAKEFLTKFHLFYYKDRSPYALQTHKMVHKVSHLFTIFLVAMMFAGLIMFNMIPMYSNYAAGRYTNGGYKNSSFEHSLYFSYPFNVSTDVTGYLIVCIFHWYVSYLCATWFCMFDLFLSLMVFHVWGHFKILIDSLENFPRPSTNYKYKLEDGTDISAEKYSRVELLKVSETLKYCISYHRDIVNFTDTMSDVFGPMLFVYYMFHQASGCLLLLECSQMTAQALIRYVPLTIILTQQLVQLSIIFELVGSESGKLKDAVYGIPWEFMDVKNRRIVTFFLANVQEPVHVKALGVADVGVTSMAAILKTSMSYFTFLRSV